MIPGMTVVVTAIAAVRKHLSYDVPAVPVTDDTSPLELRRATESGQKPLLKPVEAERLISLLRRLVSC
jgi:hypothetical protein